jgi:uncharacterized protein
MDQSITKTPARQLLSGIKVVDADTHITEWNDLWTSRAPASYRARVPQPTHIDGKWEWSIDGNPISRASGASSAIRKDGSKAYGMSFVPLQIEEVHEGAYDVKQRLRYMDEHGIAAQIGYPNLLGFGGQKSMLTSEDVRNVSLTIFNDAMAEMQADSGNRIYPMAMIPWWDVKASAREAERCAAMGLRGINMNSDPHSHGFPPLDDPSWNELWEVCVDKSLPVSFHIGASDESMSWHGAGAWPHLHEDQRLAYGSLMLFVGNLRVLANIMLSGFLDRYPTLKIVSVESGAGWVPFMLEALDYESIECALTFKTPPREIFRRQIYACTWFERKDIVHTIRRIGVENVMFETDFPHPTCLYPDDLDYMVDAIEEMTPKERQSMFGGTAERIYNMDLSNASGL